MAYHRMFRSLVMPALSSEERLCRDHKQSNNSARVQRKDIHDRVYSSRRRSRSSRRRRILSSSRSRSLSSQRSRAPFKKKKKKKGKRGKKGKKKKRKKKGGKEKKKKRKRREKKLMKKVKRNMKESNKRPPTFKEHAATLPVEVLQQQIKEMIDAKDRISLLESSLQEATRARLKRLKPSMKPPRARVFLCDRACVGPEMRRPGGRGRGPLLGRGSYTSLPGCCRMCRGPVCGRFSVCDTCTTKDVTVLNRERCTGGDTAMCGRDIARDKFNNSVHLHVGDIATGDEENNTCCKKGRSPRCGGGCGSCCGSGCGPRCSGSCAPRCSNSCGPCSPCKPCRPSGPRSRESNTSSNAECDPNDTNNACGALNLHRDNYKTGCNAIANMCEKRLNRALNCVAPATRQHNVEKCGGATSVRRAEANYRHASANDCNNNNATILKDLIYPKVYEKAVRKVSRGIPVSITRNTSIQKETYRALVDIIDRSIDVIIKKVKHV